MVRNSVVKSIVIGSIAAAALFSGCTKKPSAEEMAKLDEAKMAAESAEHKLAELRKERVQLESNLTDKQQQLQKNEAERDSLKTKMGK